MADFLSPAEWTAVLLSLRIAVVATLASLPFGIFFAYALARWRFPGKTLLAAIIYLPLVLPPVVTGYMLLIAFGRRGIFGGHEMVVRAQAVGQAEIRSLQRRRKRTGDLQGSPDL